MSDRLPQTLPYHLLGEIRQRIIEGDYLPGTPLREQELERTFGSSRGPIRESLLMLQQRGLVDHQPRRGFRVRALSVQDLGDLYRLQATLHRMMVYDFGKRDLRSVAALLGRHLDEATRHAAGTDRLALFGPLCDFDQTLIEHADNSFLRTALTAITEIALPVSFTILGLIDRPQLISRLRSVTVALHDGDLDAAAGHLDWRIKAQEALAAQAVAAGAQARPGK